MGSEPTEKEERTGDVASATTANGHLNRRSYLKAAGASIAAVAGAGLSGSAAAADYDTISVGAGERRTVRVNSGETFENKLVDITARNADFRIIARGSDWTIRNVGFRGSADVGGDSGHPNLISAEGEGVIDTVYMGDGVSSDNMAKGAIGVGAGHSGHIELRNVHMAEWTGSAIYAAAMAEEQMSGGEGSLAFDNCYFRDNNITHLRIASDGTTVDNCVVHNTNNVPVHPVSGGVVNSRGLYTGYGESSDVVTVRNSHIDVTSENTNGAASAVVSGTSSQWGPLSTVRVEDSEVRGALRGEHVHTENVGSNPQTDIQAGVPTNAEEAASDTAGDATHSPGSDSGNSDGSDEQSELTRTLTVDTYEDGPTVEYEFVVDGDLQKGSTSEGNDDVVENDDGTLTITGLTGNGYTDDYTFEGEVGGWRATVDAEHYALYVDGEEVEPPQSDDESDLGRTLTVETFDGGPLVEYEFVVDGAVEKGGDTEDNDSISEADDGTTQVTGLTSDGFTDDYSFEGDVLDWQATVDAEHYALYVDGEEVDPTQAADEEETDAEPRELTVVGVDDGPIFDYEFTVDGSVHPVTEGAGYKSESGDTVAENDDGSVTATGSTGDGCGDGFLVEGDVLDWQADTDAANYTLYLDGEAVAGGQSDDGSDDGSDDRDDSDDTAPAPEPRELTIVSVDDGPSFDYEFTVEGTASPVTSGRGYKSEGGDAVSENGDGTATVTGATGNGCGDRFVVEGEILDWKVDTDATNYTLYLDGDEVDSL